MNIKARKFSNKVDLIRSMIENRKRLMGIVDFPEKPDNWIIKKIKKIKKIFK